jgi:predicted enzyme related to lactoylglutathione lyase
MVEQSAAVARADRVGNIVALEHVNTMVPDQQLATAFYVSGLGLTRDPYLMTGVDNMWINVGRSQFHLPTGRPQVLRGRVGIVVTDLDALTERLARVAPLLAGTHFGFTPEALHVEAVLPWGNRIVCHAPHARFGAMRLGIPYVELDVPPGTADGIARFYEEVLETPAHVEENDGARAAAVTVGADQVLRFAESRAALAAYDGHHIQVYVADYDGTHERMRERGLVSEESGEHQFRFRDIVDVASGRVVYRIEHEVRSTRHPLHGRPLVNRNPAQTNVDYRPGCDAFA